jgi:hypothetical protein
MTRVRALAQSEWQRTDPSISERAGRQANARRLYATLIDRWKAGDPSLPLLRIAVERLARMPAQLVPWARVESVDRHTVPLIATRNFARTPHSSLRR